MRSPRHLDESRQQLTQLAFSLRIKQDVDVAVPQGVQGPVGEQDVETERNVVMTEIEE